MLLVVAQAQAQEPDEAAQHADATAFSESYLLPVAETVAEAGDARSLALAASLRSYALEVTQPQAQEHDARVTDWQRQALRDDGGDVLVAMLVLAARDDGQDPLSIEALGRWRTLEPGNLLPLLLAGGDEGALLRNARDTRRADARFADFIRIMLDTFERHPPSAQALEHLRGIGGASAENAALTMATNLWVRIMPSFSPLLSACIKAPSPPQIARDCRHAGEVLSGSSDTAIANLIGWSILRYVAVDAKARSRAGEQRRQLRWRLHQWQALRECSPLAKPTTAELVRAHPKIDELGMIREHLIAHGMALEPPADWSEDDAGKFSCDETSR